MVGGGRAGRKGDGDGDEGGQEGEAEHDAVAVGWVSVDDGNELMADGGGGGDLYCHVLLLPPCFLPSRHRPRQRCPSRGRARCFQQPSAQIPPWEDNMITLGPCCPDNACETNGYRNQVIAWKSLLIAALSQ